MEVDSGHAFGAILEARSVLTALIDQQAAIAKVAAHICEALRAGRYVFVIGNGGSAAEADHIAAEFIGAKVIALTNPAVLTAVSNDFGYAASFERQLGDLGQPGDVLLALSTSGDSENVLAAAQKAWEKGMIVCGLTGRTGGKLRELCDSMVMVPSLTTERIQEMHLIVGHILAARWKHDTGAAQG